MRKYLILIVTLPILLSACSKGEVVQKKHFETYEVSLGSLESDFTILSAVTGKEVSDLSFKMPGRVKEVFVDR